MMYFCTLFIYIYMTNERGTYSDSFGILFNWELQVEVLKTYDLQKQNYPMLCFLDTYIQ